MTDLFTVDGTTLRWRGGGETLVVEPWGRDSVRVRSALGDVVDADWALLAQDPSAHAQATVVVDGATATLTNGRIRVLATASSGRDWQTGSLAHDCRLAFHDEDGRLLFSETAAGGALKLRSRTYRPLPGGGVHAELTLETPAGEHLAGMGQYQQDLVDLKGATFELAHRNSQASVPFVLSSAGYGFLWHNPAIGRATFGSNRTEWSAQSCRQLDYWVTAGPTPAAITRRYAEATGHAPMMPEHGLGFWQCKLRYSSQAELLEVAREHTRRGLPLDVIVADFFHWPHMGDYRFEDEFWPDPAAMVAELDELGVELMVSVWPQVSLESENFAEMSRRNLLVSSNRGIDVQMWFGGPSRFVDVTNPEARAFLWDRCREGYGRHGIRLFWLDEAEPEYGVYDHDAYRYHAGQGLEVGNLYPQAFSRAFAEGLAADGEEAVVNLVRCAWAGSQRYGALVWSGDIHSDFPTLRRQIVAGVHMGVAGIPWFTTDIGGFGGGRTEDPAFHELLIRWFQVGTFLPVMRLHGDRAPASEVLAADGSSRQPTGAGNELWSFGAAVYDVLEHYVHLREDLRDYTRELMSAAHTDGQPVMRGLFHEFPDDPVGWTVADEYLYGPSLLVAPVLEAGATSRRVYLPEGATWTCLSSGEAYDGGRWVDVDAPLSVIPVFARDGALHQLVGRLASA
ncbi:glycoside hydrolase family 31 protein [Cellulomonas sp. Leaf395]|uniref:glycoside hydrolase family 31 protein n=1 Tax=Cellulomonas sp. Leaf395 TaxID=1736362 RepID=UPI0006F804A5|nr:TIM-barrel domain-containing protein [Cellulomonas sp. Leaf395]KQT01067.1 family 31 glucosidase [Cellulomonas sp. Leaf395]